jgi:5-formyltetrahydrofolate cyclo-ligase
MVDWKATELRQLKARLRQEAAEQRDATRNRRQASRQICDTFTSLVESANARTVALYVSIRSEVETHDLLRQELEGPRRILVPYCADRRSLRLFELRSWDELARSRFGLLEPRTELRQDLSRIVDVRDVDIAMVPGLAFDQRGGRLGYGQGYYDRLLRGARPETPLVGVAFSTQIRCTLPTAEHDVFMDRVITEEGSFQQLAE